LAEGETGEKSEQPTGRKLDKARDEGQVGKSQEVPSVAILLTGVVAVFFFSSYLFNNITDVMRDSFVFTSVPNVSITSVSQLMLRFSGKFFLIISPVLFFVLMAALVANIAQVGLKISSKALEIKFSKLNPIKGFKSKFSSRSVMELFKSLGKLLIIFSVAYFAVVGEFDNMFRLYDNSVAQILIFILKISFKIFLRILIFMAFLAAIDFAYQKWKFTEDQKMTKQEVKDEHKEVEGDPKIKSRIRQLQMEAARKRMMAEVPEADVVVTNPTHLAVAIKYDSFKMDVPCVVAKGAGVVAENIKKLAREHDVPVIEDKPLARNLYNNVEIGESVPSDLYQAIAELLAYVYRLKGKI